jgi:hypothetical protein
MYSCGPETMDFCGLWLWASVVGSGSGSEADLVEGQAAGDPYAPTRSERYRAPHTPEGGMGRPGRAHLAFFPLFLLLFFSFMATFTTYF